MHRDQSRTTQFFGGSGLHREGLTPRNMLARILVVMIFALGISAPAHAAVVLGPSNVYNENFNSMGTGTAPAIRLAGLSDRRFQQYVDQQYGLEFCAGDRGDSEWNSRGRGTASSGLTVSDNPTASQVNGYNALGASGAAGDRGIATAPTGIAGSTN